MNKKYQPILVYRILETYLLCCCRLQVFIPVIGIPQLEGHGHLLEGDVTLIPQATAQGGQ